MSKQSAYFTVENLSGHAAEDIKQGLDRLHGVISVSVNVRTNKLAVDYDSTGTSCDEIGKAIGKLGYEPQLLRNEDHIM